VLWIAETLVNKHKMLKISLLQLFSILPRRCPAESASKDQANSTRSSAVGSSSSKYAAFALPFLSAAGASTCVLSSVLVSVASSSSSQSVSESSGHRSSTYPSPYAASAAMLSFSFSAAS
jgi:hypothetical protein